MKKVKATTRAYSLLVSINRKRTLGCTKSVSTHQLRYLDEIRPMDEIGNLDSLHKVYTKERSLGKTLVENLSTQNEKSFRSLL